MRLTLQEIAKAVGGRLVAPPVEGDASAIERVEATSITWDSREVRAGALYVALPGERVDGHDFVQSAAESGAVGALVARQVSADIPQVVVSDVAAAFTNLAAYWRTRLKGVVVGLTGSTGKTTTKDLVRDVLACKGSVVATTANQNNELGVPRTLLNADAETEYVVVEMGMRGLGQIANLCAFVRTDWGVVTNVGMSHMELLGSQDNIARAKAELFAALPEHGVAFVNLDGEYASQLCEYGGLVERDIRLVGTSMGNSDFSGSNTSETRFCSQQTQAKSHIGSEDFLGRDDFAVAFGSEAKREEAFVPEESMFGGAPECIIFAQDVQLDTQGHPSFSLGCAFPDGTIQQVPCKLQLRGVHNVSNACMAAAVGTVAGLTLEQCAQALGASQPTEGRQAFKRAACGALVIDDSYNASPDSMGASLATFSALQVDGRRIAVLGDMGELGHMAVEAHHAVGRMAAEAGLDELICAGELARGIAQGALDAGMSQSSVRLVDDASHALAYVRDTLSSDDAVLVKASHSMGFNRIVEGLME